MNHTFIVLAHGESPFLEECIISLKNQSLKSDIVVSTSTPNGFIKKITDNLSPDQFIDKNLASATGGDGVFHGKHVSNTKGMPGSYKSFFNEEQIEWLRYRFSDFIKEFGYSDNKI